MAGDMPKQAYPNHTKVRVNFQIISEINGAASVEMVKKGVPQPLAAHPRLENAYSGQFIKFSAKLRKPSKQQMPPAR
ncbi:hypothetical protein SDC9_69149 [bioreactor metagenome]|uniref:Uncharacterized protein n=1 Tax=bioreactor metagenome TaxID=1076179 RepID=A0A644Y460_9ZZZZ